MTSLLHRFGTTRHSIGAGNSQSSSNIGLFPRGRPDAGRKLRGTAAFRLSSPPGCKGGRTGARSELAPGVVKLRPPEKWRVKDGNGTENHDPGR